jgi:hypothetical protein
LPPSIGPITQGGQPSGEEVIEAQINTHGQETTWEISLNCLGEPRCQHAEGRLPADSGIQIVSAKFTGLETGVAYHYAIEASSSGGEVLNTWEFTIQPAPPGAAPEGNKDKEVYTPPELPWANQSGNEAAARTVREQREKEQEEQKAKEAAVSHAAEGAALKRRQEEAAQQTAARLQEEPACAVPELKGDTLAVARRKLAAAHCRLGTVHRSGHHQSRLRVTKESARAGERLADNAPVSLWIGAKTNAR